MWPFTKRQTLRDNGFFKTFTEYHCHLLPGVDDGVKTMEESLELLTFYEEMGIKEIWLTPHIMEDMPNTTAHLQQRFSELIQAYKGNILLHLAAENMLDNLFDERLTNNDLLPIGNEGKQLLVETSYFNPPMDLYETLEQIKSSGLYPILAHPERYMYMEPKDYDRLKEMGVLFQLNLTSLAGMYGKIAQKKAENLLKKGYYNFSGTDTHRISQISFLANQAKIEQAKIELALSLCNSQLYKDHS